MTDTNYRSDYECITIYHHSHSQMREVHHKILNYVKNHGSHLTYYSSSPIWPEE